jgi:hypothetical protein
MIIESGIIIFLGLLFIFIKLPARRALILLNYPVWVDVVVSVLAFIMHYGTFSGVMAAAVAGLMTSCFTTIGRKLFGYIDPKLNQYYPGYVRLNVKDLK